MRCLVPRRLLTTTCLLTTALGTLQAESPPTLTLPAGIPIKMDGWPNPSEWSDAEQLAWGDERARLWAKQCRGMLLLAMATRDPWPAGGRVQIHLAPGEAAAGVLTPGTLSIDYEPRQHDRPHLILSRHTEVGPERVEGEAVARFRSSRDGAGWEIAVTANAVKEGPHRMLVQWTTPGTPDRGVWPANVPVRSRARSRPPGHTSGATWGRVQGLTGSGPGAWPATQWSKFVNADTALANHGDAMHSYVRLLVEEWKNQPRDDKVAEASFFKPLAAIQAVEPLTAQDLLAKARVLHWLNRREAALGTLRAVHSLDPMTGKHVESDQARLLQSMHRFDDAATMWRGIGARRGLPAIVQQQYEALARRAESMGAAWQKEQELRQVDEQVADQPLVSLTTDHGTAVLLLHRNRAPKAVDHFLSLVEAGAYDGTLFHRVIGDALAHGGALASKTHGCDFTYEQAAAAEPPAIPERANTEHQFFAGALALHWHPDRTFKSEFFVVTGPHPDWARERHLIIGHVWTGQTVMDRVSQCDPIRAMRVLRR